MKAALFFKTTLFTIFLFNLSLTQAQDVCQEGDCSKDFLSIQLDGPLNVNPADLPNQKRTDQYKNAYLKVKQLKNDHELKPGRKNRYNTNQLNGKSCARLNQLESYFANEYLQNPDFKQFIDAVESDPEAFKENGFESSRRAINMTTRMKDKCPEDIKNLDKDNAPKTEDVPQSFMNIGIAQGYFDKDGKQLKEMKDLSGDSPADTGKDKMSKKEQIAQLKNKVTNLPIGAPVQDKIKGITDGLGAAKPKLGVLKDLIGGCQPKFAKLLPRPKGLLDKIKPVQNLLSGLSSFKPKVPRPGLFDKIGNLFKKGEKLGNTVKNLGDRANKLKSNFDNVTGKTEQANKKLAEQEQKVKALQDRLKELQEEKDNLAARLEDKPRKYLEELTDLVNKIEKKAADFNNDVNAEAKKKDDLLKEIEDLEKQKADIADNVKKLEDEMDQLTKEEEALTKEADKAAAEVEQVKQDEAAMDKMADKLNNLKPDDQLKDELEICESELKDLLTKITGLDEVQEKTKKKAKGLFGLPTKLKEKVSNLKLFQNKLKLGKNGIPLVSKTLGKLDQLTNKANRLGSMVETLTGKKTGLQEKIENIDKKIEQVKAGYEDRVANLDKYKGELVDLIAERSGLKDKLNQAGSDVQDLEKTIQDYIQKFNLFDDKDECIKLSELEDQVEDIEKDQEATDKELDGFEDEAEDLSKQEEQLEQDTKELEEQIDQDTQKAEELKQEEEALKEEYGEDIKLDPVEPEEWAESFEVERPYWDAVFHPDDEVVEGMKGRYFEVKLKDADKNVKLLFGPGEYFMDKSTFRKTYGSTIGAFVTEALHAMKQADKNRVKLFIQGSADIAGHNTFSGKLNDRFFYDLVDVLPQQEDDPERFLSGAVKKDIPETNFRNSHLPDLRGQYLKEMISVYSKKFDPIVLEGAVKDFQDEEERNAIIYLFFPDELLSSYGNE
jgi:uncharacterized coiled-coil DUF342 family protein